MGQLATDFQPRILKVEEAARLLRVSNSTVHNWIQKGAIPYIKLPGAGQRAEYRIPLRGLLASMTSNFDLSGALQELAEAAAAQGLGGDEAVRAAGGEPDPELE